MLASPRRLARLALLLCLTAACGDRAVELGDRSFQVEGAGTAVAVSTADGPVGSGLEVVAIIGAGFDAVPFGRVGGTALFDDGGIVLYESSLCRLHTFAPDFTPIASFSRCGDGPTELRNGRMLFVVGDTIVALDGRRRRLVRFHRSGAFIDATPVVLPPIGPLSTQSVSALAGTVVNATFVTPLDPAPTAPGVSDSMPLAGRLDFATGLILDTVRAQHPRIAYTSGWTGLMGYPQCASPNGATMVMLNRWSHQVAMISAREHRVTALLSTPDDWPAVSHTAGSEVGFPSAPILGVACGGEVFTAMQFLIDEANPRGVPLEGWIATWDYAGELKRLDRLAKADSVLYGVPAAVDGDLLFIRNNNGLDAPALVVARARGGRGVGRAP